MEAPFTLGGLAKATGYSECWLRDAVHRGRLFHPLPCVWCGSVRPVCRVRLSTFSRWLEEEELL